MIIIMMTVMTVMTMMMLMMKMTTHQEWLTQHQDSTCLGPVTLILMLMINYDDYKCALYFHTNHHHGYRWLHFVARRVGGHGGGGSRGDQGVGGGGRVRPYGGRRVRHQDTRWVS